MRTVAPPGFDLSKFYEGIYTFQHWEIFPGFKTKGNKDVARVMAGLEVPHDLTGKRILEIAPWNGFFSFECARRGAAEIVSLGPDDPDRTGYNKTRDFLEIDNCTYVRGSVYELSPHKHGTFDIVLFLGIIYHLRYPLLALDKIYEVTRKNLYVDSPIIDRKVFDRTVSGEVAQRILSEGDVIHNLPMLYFTKKDETGDPYNWFLPNRRALHALIASAGFDIVHARDNGLTWAWVSAVKGKRSFEVGFEGYNPDTATWRSNN